MQLVTDSLNALMGIPFMSVKIPTKPMATPPNMPFLTVVFPVFLQALGRCNQWESLDFLLSFSSTAAIFGAAGQGNYAAANACMDAWMSKYRQQLRTELDGAAGSLKKLIKH